VEIFIPSAVEIYDPEYMVLFPSGVTRLDGDKALLYVSYELPEEERELAVFRRQRFFLGLLNRLGEKNEALKNPAETQIYRGLMSSGMSQRARQRLFDEFAGIDMSRTTVQSVGGNFREVSGQRLLFPDYDGTLIKDIIRQTLGRLTRQLEGSLSERVFTVEILNGSGVSGLAGRTAEVLRSFGYDVISIGNASRDDYAATEIIDHSGYEDMAKAFGDTIRCGKIRYESSVPGAADPADTGMEMDPQNFEYRADFTLILGKDFNFDGRHVTGQ
jgi:hypothetical protein